MSSNAPTLYDRLGGVYAIATVVDDLIDRVMSNPILNANPAVDEAHHRVSPAGFKYLVTEMVCWASGGPQQYSGRATGGVGRFLQGFRRHHGQVWRSRRREKRTLCDRAKHEG